MKIKLKEICHGRSGDKGDAANIGLIAYKKEDYKLIKKQVTAAKVKKFFEGICLGKVERFEMPNINALNFLLHETLGGGGTVSLKLDAQGKTLASALLRMEIDVKPEKEKKKSAKEKQKKEKSKKKNRKIKL